MNGTSRGSLRFVSFRFVRAHLHPSSAASGRGHDNSVKTPCNRRGYPGGGGTTHCWETVPEASRAEEAIPNVQNGLSVQVPTGDHPF